MADEAAVALEAWRTLADWRAEGAVPFALGAAAPTPRIARLRVQPISYLSPLLPGSEADEERFLASVRTRLGDRIECLPLGRARAGLHLLAKFATSRGRKKVVLSPYTIPDVVWMVVLAGGEPVFVDFEPRTSTIDLNQLEELVDDRTGCVLITHYHLNQPHVHEMRAICARRGAYLFDDCAISFGGDIGGRPVGTLTDASVFSFSTLKFVNFFYGGVVATANPEIARFAREHLAEWPRLRTRDYVTPMLRGMKLDLATRPIVFDGFTFPTLQAKARRNGGAGLENARPESESLDRTLTSRPSLSAYREWNRKLGRVDQERRDRRRIARIYMEKLRPHMVTPDVSDAIVAGSCFMNFPILAPPAERHDISQRLIREGFDVGRNTYPNLHAHERFKHFPGRSEHASRIAEGSIFLPTHFAVTETYARDLAAEAASLLG